MSNTAKFISGDGVEHEVAIGSPAFEHMTKDGSFTRLDDEVTYTEAEAIEMNDGVDESSAAKAESSATENTEISEAVPVVEASIEEAPAEAVAEEAPAEKKTSKKK